MVSDQHPPSVAACTHGNALGCRRCGTNPRALAAKERAADDQLEADQKAAAARQLAECPHCDQIGYVLDVSPVLRCDHAGPPREDPPLVPSEDVARPGIQPAVSQSRLARARLDPDHRALRREIQATGWELLLPDNADRLLDVLTLSTTMREPPCLEELIGSAYPGHDVLAEAARWDPRAGGGASGGGGLAAALQGAGHTEPEDLGQLLELLTTIGVVTTDGQRRRRLSIPIPSPEDVLPTTRDWLRQREDLEKVGV